MNGCKHRKRLSAYLDGELPPEIQAAVADHLASCAACRRELAGLQALGPALGRLEVPPSPAGLAARITAEARRLQSESGWRRLVGRLSATMPDWSWGLKALGTVAMVLLMLYLGQLTSTRGWLPESPGRHSAISTTAGSTAEGLEWFAAAPPGSLLSGYLAMAEQAGPDAHKP